MSYDLLLSLVTLAAAATLAPGPNNALVASSSATFGLRRTAPHIVGIVIGFPLMMLIVGLTLGEVFQRSDLLREGLRLVGAALLLWIAWKLWSAGGLSGSGGRARPFTFLEAAGFQWINPKAWAMAVAVTAQFISPAAPVVTAAVIALVFSCVGGFSISTWAVAGALLTRWLSTERRLKLFNRVMAVLIVLSVALLFVG
ncbi:LysE family translocator [Tranquillimonas alkanivorans]|uniref:Threonine/homoserine/homoserine lactone efflux protein n=1 Tax=Tranquillimonas alkanivorans TaxID=441119 RepID=A0A1I5LFX6_9RHOB|nr:LysE family translocator [Tranquillimonas alkanivorans]SFO96082.1 Threonine/homoserine/homoserine lactone efflux protein [Tranquillimonas alkanivorans]